MQHCVTLYGEMRHCQWTPWPSALPHSRPHATPDRTGIPRRFTAPRAREASEARDLARLRTFG